MRTPRALAILLASALLCSLPAAAGARTTYYVSMGDSLGAGYKPTPTGGGSIAKTGYTDVLLSRARRRIPGLRVLKLSCPGETTRSFIAGGRCSYSGGAARGKSQLVAAKRFLRANRARIAFATLSIGAKDVQSCGDVDGAVDVSCVAAGLAKVRRNLPRITRELRAAAGPRVRIAVLLHYDPFLAFYLHGGEYRGLAALTVGHVRALNRAIAAAARAQRFRTADAFRAFRTTDLSPATVNGVSVPASVVSICKYTFMCTAPPQGPDIHLNDAGYRLVAGLFLRRVL